MEIQYQEGIIMGILIRSPVRSLLRFKCVSKSWKTLISESYFKMKHLSHAKNDLNSQKLLVRESFASGSQMEIHPYYQDFTISPVVFVCGAFHWLGCSYNYSVVSFSTSNEVYRDIPLLERMYRFDHKQSSNYGISVLGGMLCFYSTDNYHRDQPVTFQLWGMKEYGVLESWTELFTLRASDSYKITPKYRYADGDVLLRCSLDFRRQSFYGRVFRISKGQLVGVSGSQSAFQEGIVYTESLISLNHLFNICLYMIETCFSSF
ncbi:hypothetical protein H5410_054465 [Solanum commersonii]|uniref:F-box domain-containing protein n=1 Tax=Solanum commersonii TaxID=4109 RepID=A0A9J5WF02_SOLCO|nr:hypothetical protein H5410_054465 [Solanum commersonii]